MGPRSAQRMAYHLLERNREGGGHLAEALTSAMEGVRQCSRCRNFAERDLCPICLDSRRDQSQVCVVSSPADVLAIEHSGEYRGRYFVLLGQLSPIDGMGPETLRVGELERRVAQDGVKEVVLATNPTAEGDATAHYLADRLHDSSIQVSRIAYGMPLGGDIEYADHVTVSRAIENRRSIAD